MGKKSNKSKVKNTNTPKVSLLTVTQFKRIPFIHNLSKIIENQKYKDIHEWVIVNGCNNDEDFDKFNIEIQKVKCNVKIVHASDKNLEYRFIGAFRNLGNRTVTGDYIICMDDDDYYFPEYVQECVKAFDKKKNIDLIGCSGMLMYDYGLNTVFSLTPFGDRHTVNCCMSYRKKYADTHLYDETRATGEEKSFLDDYVNPMIQLPNNIAIVHMSYADNTYNGKRENMLNAMGMYFNSPSNGTKMYTPKSNPLTFYIKNKEIYETYLKNFSAINSQIKTDITFYYGNMEASWDPRTTIKSINTKSIYFGKEAIKLGLSVSIYGKFDFNYLEFEGIHFYNIRNFNTFTNFKYLILMSLGGLTPLFMDEYIINNIKYEKIFVNVEHSYEIINKYINEYNSNFTYIFKNNIQEAMIDSKIKINHPITNKIIVPNGINLEVFKKDYNVERNKYRFCYVSSMYNGIFIIIDKIWSKIIKLFPNAEFHIYIDDIDSSGMSDQDKMFAKEQISKNGVFVHRRVSQEEIAIELHKSTFLLNYTHTASDPDCLSVMEALASGCIPIIWNIGVFQRFVGLKCPYHIYKEDDMDKLVQEISTLINDHDSLKNEISTLVNSNCIISWESSVNMFYQQVVNGYNFEELLKAEEAEKAEAEKKKIELPKNIDLSKYVDSDSSSESDSDNDDNTDIKVSLLTISQKKRLPFLHNLSKIIENQKYKNIHEWVIVNGSKEEDDIDIFDEEVKKVKCSVTNIVNISDKSIKNRCIGAFRNIGNMNTTGDYIICMDDDDYYFPEYIESCVKIFNKKSYDLIGCSGMFMYDYGLDTLFSLKPFGDTHTVNCCLAYRKKYSDTHFYDNDKAVGEERDFLEDYINPMYQLDPNLSVIHMNYADNTFNDKRANMCNMLLRSLIDKNNIKMYEAQTKCLSEYIDDNNIYNNYINIFSKINNQEKTDFVLYYGNVEGEWDPVSNDLNKIYELSLEWGEFLIEENYTISVYGNFKFNYKEYKGIHFYNVRNFDLHNEMKYFIIMDVMGFFPLFLEENIFRKIKCDKIFVNLESPIDMFVEHITKIHYEKITFIFKNDIHPKVRNLPIYNNLKLVIIPNGINIKLFNFNNNIRKEPKRFCILNKIDKYYFSFINRVWRILVDKHPDATLHIYNSHIDSNKIEEGKKDYFNDVLSLKGIHVYGRVSKTEIINELEKSSFLINFTNDLLNFDTISTMEAIASGCIPIMYENNPIYERLAGIKFPYNIEDTTELNKIIEPINYLLDNEEKLIESCKEISISNSFFNLDAIKNQFITQIITYFNPTVINFQPPPAPKDFDLPNSIDLSKYVDSNSDSDSDSDSESDSDSKNVNNISDEELSEDSDIDLNNIQDQFDRNQNKFDELVEIVSVTPTIKRVNKLKKIELKLDKLTKLISSNTQVEKVSDADISIII